MKLLVFLLAAVSAAAQSRQEILGRLSEITGLAVRRPVAEKTMARAELKAYFEARIKEVVKPEEIRIEELVLRMFGFAPKDFDLKKSTIDLMAEQAAAFYDYRKKQMVLLDTAGGGDAMQEMALIHELAHALADQHFQLERFLRKGSTSDDSAMARTAVMEGQATYLMSEFMARKMGQSLKDSPMMVDMMSRTAASGGSGFPVFESVPLYMRESLVFPYSKGMLFQHKAVEKYGQRAYREVFERAPATTREILHPEAYFDQVKPLPVTLPGLANSRGWKKQAEGTAGEFDHSILVKQYAKGEGDLASKWRGGAYRLWERKKDRRAVLSYGSAWEDEKSARQYFKAYRAVLEGKLTGCVFELDSETDLAGKSAEGHFHARLLGSTVTSIEGLERADDAAR